MIVEVPLAAELGELVYMERRIQRLNKGSVASLAISYIKDDRGVTLRDLADLILAGWNRSNVGPLISFALSISVTYPGFLEMFQRSRFRGLLAKDWASAFPELPASRALVDRLAREKAVYEDALAARKAEPAEMQLLLITEVIADNAAGFAAMLGVRNPRLNIGRIVWPELPILEGRDLDVMTLVDLVFAMGAREITRLLLGFFGIVPTVASLICVLASGDDELIRELWVHAPDEVRMRRVGGWVKTPARSPVSLATRHGKCYQHRSSRGAHGRRSIGRGSLRGGSGGI
jgi:hypothetical protein